MKPDETNDKIHSLLGVGLDASPDDEVRLTKGPNFALVGGKEETHEMMKETVCKVNENLHRRGKELQETSRQEFLDVFHEVMESMNHRWDS
ncbi:MAG: hypothetical protein E7028_10550 [Planctomycetaceae bacterium]|nr:hypothetical protein [Planctomycetaceae bacterium]